MPQSKEAKPLGKGSARTVVSIPVELVTRIDTLIDKQGGEALRNLGVGPETLRSGFVHKLLGEALDTAEAA